MLDSRVLELTEGQATLAAAVLSNGHNASPCFYLCEGLNCGTQCGNGNTEINKTCKDHSVSLNLLCLTLTAC